MPQGTVQVDASVAVLWCQGVRRPGGRCLKAADHGDDLQGQGSPGEGAADDHCEESLRGGPRQGSRPCPEADERGKAAGGDLLGTGRLEATGRGLGQCGGLAGGREPVQAHAEEAEVREGDLGLWRRARPQVEARPDRGLHQAQDEGQEAV